MSSKYSLVISDEAVADILDAFLWYEAARRGLGYDFELCMEAVLNRIVDKPREFQTRYKNIRIAFIQRFPYGIHYVIESQIIKVVAVFHTA